MSGVRIQAVILTEGLRWPIMYVCMCWQQSNLSRASKKNCSIVRQILFTMYKRRTNRLFELDRKFFSITVAMRTGHCVMGGNVKNCNYHPHTTGKVVGLLKEKKLLCSFFVNVDFSRGLLFKTFIPYQLNGAIIPGHQRHSFVHKTFRIISSLRLARFQCTTLVL